MLSIYNKVIVTYNLYALKDIPYRSEALADFLQATILDELHGAFCELDMAYQAHFTKEKITIQEQLRQNQKLQSIVESSSDKLAFVKASRAGQQAEKDALQLQLDQELRKIKELEEEKKAVNEFSEVEMAQLRQNYDATKEEKQEKLHQLKETISQIKELINSKQAAMQETQSEQIKEVSHLQT
jgi:hypothetical protein